jgi:hypothetical protein
MCEPNKQAGRGVFRRFNEALSALIGPSCRKHRNSISGKHTTASPQLMGYLTASWHGWQVELSREVGSDD